MVDEWFDYIEMRDNEMGTKDNKTPAGVESVVEVEFTVLGGVDLDRFDELLDCFIEDNIEDTELAEFRDMILDARRTDGKD